jgi:hypothetical protein
MLKLESLDIYREIDPMFEHLVERGLEPSVSERSFLRL